MTDPLGFIQTSLNRIEGKIDDGLKDHGDRISTIEGSISASRWILGIILTVMGLVLAGVALA